MAANEQSIKYSEYVVNVDKYEPIGNTARVLPSGFYKPYYDNYNDRYFLSTKAIIMPHLYELDDSVQTMILDDIEKFWASEERYRKFGSVYKRNILLYSVPGNGKTSLINIISQKLIEKYDGIIMYIDSPKELLAYTECMQRFRSIEPHRKVVTIIEDFERLADEKELAALLLQMLDGNEQLDNVVTIATTNYPQILEKRFTARPSRFNLAIEYPKPSENVRRQYMRLKLMDGGIDVNDASVAEDIERLVAKTENYTFDCVKEVIQAIYVDGIKEECVFKRLNDIINSNGTLQIEEEKPRQAGLIKNELKERLSGYGEYDIPAKHRINGLQHAID